VNPKILKSFIKKEFLHIFRDYRTLLVLFGMPMVQVILFGYAITTDLRNVKIAVFDQSKDEKSISLVNEITASGFYMVTSLMENSDEIAGQFEKGEVKAVLLIGENFNSRLYNGSASVEIIADAADPNTANIVSNQIQGIVQRWVMRQNNGKAVVPGIITEVRMHYNPSMKSVLLFVPGVITIILMLVSAMLTSISIAREKELGNMEILLVSPIKPATVIIGKLLPYLVLALTLAMFILGIGNVVFHVPINGSFLLLLGECLLFIIVSLSLGVFISTKVQTQQMALMLSLFALMMPTIILSGFIFPISSMPAPLQFLSHLMPPKYFIIIIRSIMLKGVGLMAIWKETLVLLLMAFVFIMASVKNYKIRLT
jgi:ABC-2 type transport system permease protein